MFLYRVENLEALKARGGFYNDFTGIGYSPSFKGDRSVPRLYFFKDEVDKLKPLFISIEAFLENVAKQQNLVYKSKDFYPVRFKSLPNLEEYLDEEWSPKISYYYEFIKNEAQKLIVSIEDIEYWDKNFAKWKKL